MAEREVRVGLASFVKADSPSNGERLEPQWGFALFGATVDVHDSDLERFDRLNGPTVAPTVPLPEVEPVNDLTTQEPPRAGRGSGLDSWLEYAASLDIEVPEGASRDDVIALVDDAEKK